MKHFPIKYDNFRNHSCFRKYLLSDKVLRKFDDFYIETIKGYTSWYSYDLNKEKINEQ